MIEHDHQVRLFQWAAVNEDIVPELALLHAIPLGGKRPPRTAARLKAEGVKAGVPDICLPVPMHSAEHTTICGLYIELKVNRRRPTKNQMWWLRELSRQGFRTQVAMGWEEARDTICDYLGLEPDHPARGVV